LKLSENSPVARWLLKTEPDCYSWAALERDKKTTWDGVTNALALKHIRSMSKGDEAIIYHTGDERAAVGVAQVVSAPYPDPAAGDEKLAVVDLKPKQKLTRPVTLDDIKADPAFAGWDLLRIGRLSVVPVPDAMWDRLLDLAKGDGGGDNARAAPTPRRAAKRTKG
jgi:predicted RNA-binding protein with PUA-like domain